MSDFNLEDYHYKKSDLLPCKKCGSDDIEVSRVIPRYPACVDPNAWDYYVTCQGCKEYAYHIGLDITILDWNRANA